MSQIRQGEASWESASRAGWVPQVLIRPISSPAIDVQNTVSPTSSCGVASASTWSSTPRSRKISIARWLVMCARGVLAVHRYLVIMMFGTPRAARLSAAAPPAGPEPTISTSVSTAGPAGISVSAIPSLKAGMSSAPLSLCAIVSAVACRRQGPRGRMAEIRSPARGAARFLRLEGDAARLRGTGAGDPGGWQRDEPAVRDQAKRVREARARARARNPQQADRGSAGRARPQGDRGLLRAGRDVRGQDAGQPPGRERVADELKLGPGAGTGRGALVLGAGAAHDRPAVGRDQGASAEERLRPGQPEDAPAVGEQVTTVARHGELPHILGLPAAGGRLRGVGEGQVAAVGRPGQAEGVLARARDVGPELVRGAPRMQRFTGRHRVNPQRHAVSRLDHEGELASVGRERHALHNAGCGAPGGGGGRYKKRPDRGWFAGCVAWTWSSRRNVRSSSAAVTPLNDPPSGGLTVASRRPGRESPTIAGGCGRGS